MAELSPDHWAHRAVQRLEKYGVSVNDETLRFSSSRYELARRVMGVLEFLEWLSGTGPAPESPADLSAAALYVRAQVSIDRAERILTALSDLEIDPSSVSHRYHTRDLSNHTLQRLRAGVEGFQDRLRALRAEVVALRRLKATTSAHIVNEPSVVMLRERLDKLYLEIAETLDPTLGRLVQPDLDEVLKEAEPSMVSVIGHWVALQEESGATSGLRSGRETVAADQSELLVAMLASDVRALVRDFRVEINTLGGSTTTFAHIMQSIPLRMSEVERPIQSAQTDLLSFDRVGLENGAWGQDDVQETVVMSLPLLGDRSRLSATVRRHVDVDRLREATTTVSREERSGRSEGLALAGEVKVGTSASVRVGYELVPSENDGTFTSSRAVMGADVEYDFGEYGTVQAGYHWGTGEQNERKGAGFGVGYRIGDHTSLLASYSMVRFEHDHDQEIGRSLGEAKLVVRF